MTSLKSGVPSSRIDPTRTTMLRNRFAIRLRSHFNHLKRDINSLLISEDVFGLKLPLNPITGNYTLNTRWSALTSAEKLKAFTLWLRLKLGNSVLSLTEEQLWQKYTEDGFRKGVERSFNDVKGVSPQLFATRQEFLRASFFSPVSVEKVKLLASRSFEDLKGVTSTMSTQMVRILTDGLVQGKGVREVARELSSTVDGIGKTRSLMIARTELIRAHSEGQLDALESLGIEDVGVMVEWSITANACPLCIPLEGVVLNITEARGMIPRHPNCRCAWIPANLGEKDASQKRSKRQIDKAIAESAKKETREPTKAAAIDSSTWLGVDKDIESKRPTRNVSFEELIRYLKGGL